MDKSYNDLKKEAKELGITVQIGTSKPELATLIAKAKDIESEEKPQDVPTSETSKVACPDCTVSVEHGGKSEFVSRSGVIKAGLLNPDTICPRCEGSGQVEAPEDLSEPEE